MGQRESGVLMHISSLPSPYGIGNIGESSRKFVDFLKKSGQMYWQVLPLAYTGFGASPYQSFSAFAGNPYLIDPEEIYNNGLLTKDELLSLSDNESKDRVNYNRIYENRKYILRKAFQRVQQPLKKQIEQFYNENIDWLEGFAFFMALRERFDLKPVFEWEDKAIRNIEQNAVDMYKSLLKDNIDYYIFVQYLFFEQWKKLKKYANDNGIKIIGDIPIYISADSSDVWQNRELFKVDNELNMISQAGVPPDYYSETGQLWGNPIYDWDYHEKTNYKWWIKRIRHSLKLYDVIRLDHFRGFYNYWEVPIGEKTAINGKWQKGPGSQLFDAIKDKLGNVFFIAEDLGNIDDNVRKFVKDSGFPGMKVLVFGFSPYKDNEHLPHNYPENSVVYTSTHDCPTICEQILDCLNDDERKFAYEYLRTSFNESIGWSAIKTLFASSARITIVPIQDVLSLGHDARMNLPGSVGGYNWSWRVREDGLNDDVANTFKNITKIYKRNLGKDEKINEKIAKR